MISRAPEHDPIDMPEVLKARSVASIDTSIPATSRRLSRERDYSEAGFTKAGVPSKPL